MKQVKILLLLFFMTVSGVSLANSHILIVNQGNAETNHTLLEVEGDDQSEKDSIKIGKGQKITRIASSRATPIGYGSTLDSLQKRMDSEDQTNLDNIGHPGSLSCQNSHIVIFANAFNKLLRGEVKPERLDLKYVIIGIAGYDEHHDKMIDSLYTDPNNSSTQIMTRKRNFELGVREYLQQEKVVVDRIKVLDIRSDMELASTALGWDVDQEKWRSDYSCIFLTSYCLGRHVKAGELMKIYGAPKTGGYFDLGKTVGVTYLSDVSDPAKSDVSDPAKKEVEDRVRSVLSAFREMNVAKDYKELPNNEELASKIKGVRYHENAKLAVKNKAEILQRWQTKRNEPGYAAAWITERQAIKKVDNITFDKAKEALLQDIEKAGDSIAVLATILWSNRPHKGEEKLDEPPLVIGGDFPFVDLGFSLETGNPDLNRSIQTMNKDAFNKAIIRAGLKLLGGESTQLIEGL